jgi:hypothetical protein
MLLCKDCRWIEPGSERASLPMVIRCLHPMATQEEIVNVVNGETIRPQHLCMTFRLAWHPCGPDAVLFEAKEG